MFLGPDMGDGRGAGGMSRITRLDQTDSIVPHDAAWHMSQNPDHPVTKAFKTALTAPSKVTEPQSGIINKFIKRFPADPADETHPLYVGIHFDSREQRDAFADKISRDGGYKFDKLVSSSTRDPGVAKVFAEKGNAGLILKIVKSTDSARDVSPISKILSKFGTQQESMIIRGSRFVTPTTGPGTVQLRTGPAPVFRLAEVKAASRS